MDLKIVENTNEEVLIEVIFADEIDKISNKGFSGREKYIKYKKGNAILVSLYDEEGINFSSFYFATRSNSFVSSDTGLLKDKVYRFLMSQHIQPNNLNSEAETELIITVPKHGSEEDYDVSLGGSPAIFLKTEEEIKDLFGEYQVCNTGTTSEGRVFHQARLV